MINQFRKHTQFNIALLIILGIILSIGVFFHLPDNLVPVLFEPAISNFTGQIVKNDITPEFNVLLTLALTITQALLLNQIINEYGLIGRPSFLPALLYVTLASLILPFLVLSPVMIVNFLSIWMLQKLLSIYRRGDIKSVMYDLGLIVALGSLIYFPFIAMILLLWLSLYIFRPFNWREWIIPIVGVVTIYFLLGAIYFLLDRTEQFYQIWLPITRLTPSSISIDRHDALILIPLILIAVLFLITLRQYFFKSVVHIRKSFALLFCMLLLAVLSFLLTDEPHLHHFLLCVSPLAVYFSYYFNYAGVRWIYESVFALLLLSILYLQFF